MSRKPPVHGDYVLATKYSDGDPGDQFAVGFYDRSFYHFGQERHLVVDNDGNQFRANGFRRVDRISHERGCWLVAHFPEIEKSGRSLWWWRRQSMTVPEPSRTVPDLPNAESANSAE